MADYHYLKSSQIGRVNQIRFAMAGPAFSVETPEKLPLPKLISSELISYNRSEMSGFSDLISNSLMRSLAKGFLQKVLRNFCVCFAEICRNVSAMTPSRMTP